MSCEQWIDRFIGAPLDEAARAHLAECAGCRARWQERAVEPTEEELAALHSAVMRQVIAEPVERRVWWPAAAVAGLVLAGGLVWWKEKPVKRIAFDPPVPLAPRHAVLAPAPVTAATMPVKRTRRKLRPASPAGVQSMNVAQASEELTSIRLKTTDPNVVLIWLMPEKESVDDE